VWSQRFILLSGAHLYSSNFNTRRVVEGVRGPHWARNETDHGDTPSTPHHRAPPLLVQSAKSNPMYSYALDHRTTLLFYFSGHARVYKPSLFLRNDEQSSRRESPRVNTESLPFPDRRHSVS
jgi:hypothetical protein